LEAELSERRTYRSNQYLGRFSPARKSSAAGRTSKTDLIKGFISKKGRPFDAFLVRADAKIRWEFPPRAAKTGKDGKPVERKARAKADLSKAKVIGESKTHGGELVETEDAYYVRKPDQDNRQVFKLSRKLCEHDITPEEVKELLSEGRSPLIEDFVSKRGNKIGGILAQLSTVAPIPASRCVPFPIAVELPGALGLLAR
jgi:DNA topoisomerase-3